MDIDVERLNIFIAYNGRVADAKPFFDGALNPRPAVRKPQLSVSPPHIKKISSLTRDFYS